jgi:signal transduction histidine kinase
MLDSAMYAEFVAQDHFPFHSRDVTPTGGSPAGAGPQATVPVLVEAGTIDRRPQEQAAVCFCVLEALQNVQKYAGASQATVRLNEADGVLRFEVDDDGCGFEVATVRRGSGLINVADRLDALDGRLEIDSAVGRGCRLRGELPVPQTV